MGGIPLSETLAVKWRLNAGDDLQSAIDQVAGQGGGVILLSPGKHWIDRTIQMKSAVVLRGASKESSVLKIRMKALFLNLQGVKRQRRSR